MMLNRNDTTHHSYILLQDHLSTASSETKKRIKNRLEVMTPAERTISCNNHSFLIYVVKNLLSFDEFFSLNHAQIERLNTPFIQSLIESDSITPKEVVHLNTQRAIILCSKPVWFLIQFKHLTVDEALEINNTFEFLDQNLSLFNAIRHYELKPNDCLSFYNTIKPYPELLTALNQDKISIDDARLCLELFGALSIENLIAHHIADIIRTFYRHATNCPVIPETFNQFCAINNGLTFFAKNMIQTRIKILASYPEIELLFTQNILSIPEKCNRPGFLEKLSQSNGYRSFCSKTIKLSKNPYWIFHEASKEETQNESRCISAASVWNSTPQSQ